MTSLVKKLVTTSRVGVILYTIGFILSFIICAGMIWGDFEASLFASSFATDEPLTTLSCPVVISDKETGRVTARFTNHTDLALSTNVRSYISQGYISEILESDIPLKLQSGESKILDWTIEPDEAVWGRLVMVRIYTLRRYPYPSYTGTCGILVVDILGIPGKYLLSIGLILGLGGLLAGTYLLRKELQSRKYVSSSAPTIFTALAVVTIIGLVISSTGNWPFGFLTLILTILLCAILLSNRISES